MDPCREKGGVPPGAGGVAAFTDGELNFTRGSPRRAGGGAISRALRLSFAAGSPGRGWGGGLFALPYPFRFRFPRARVGWRLMSPYARCSARVPPGAGGVAVFPESVVATVEGSPGRGWGGAYRTGQAPPRSWFPRARVGWRLTGGAGPRARRGPPGAGGGARALVHGPP